jgi:hypothetical protein
MCEGFPEHLHARSVVNGSIVGSDSRMFQYRSQGRRGVPFHAADALGEYLYGLICMALIGRKDLHHGGVMFTPTIPSRTSDIEPDHFKVRNQGIQSRQKAIHPTLVELIG